MSARSRSHPWWGPRRRRPVYIKPDALLAARGPVADALRNGPGWPGFPALAQADWTPRTREEQIDDDLGALARVVEQVAPATVYIVPLLLPLKRYGRKRAHWRRLAAERSARSIGYITGWPRRFQRHVEPGPPLSETLACHQQGARR